MSAPALETRGLSVTRGGKHLLNGIDVAIPAGAHAVIIGPNGAGKSTLLRCLAGLWRPDRGTVLIHGDDSRSLSRRRIAQRISYVPQIPEPSLPYTVREFVLLARYPNQKRWAASTAEDTRLADDALGQAGVKPFADRIMSSLSGGEARRVHVAAALAQGGDILLLDEPTTHMDFLHQRELHALIESLRSAQSRTIVSVSHEIHAGVSAADRLLVLREGKLLHHGAPDDWLTHDNLRDLYGVEFDAVEQSGRTRWIPAHA